MLTDKQLKDVCLAFDGPPKACRYLESRPTGYQCMKLRPERAQIDKKLNEFMQSCKKGGLDPYAQGAPLGDNCAGCLILKAISVGKPS